MNRTQGKTSNDMYNKILDVLLDGYKGGRGWGGRAPDDFWEPICCVKLSVKIIFVYWEDTQNTQIPAKKSFMLMRM